ncbi:M23 family metallopeptidase [Arenibaculum pallidiluteum]|uniref:M23 family metallopeptidase n=1 Tax=Arenibaculum pallidiluteum TaxID=2812559 RepID=UPI001A9629E0|nr:M23 family metallopeptidase [Arenibaculum pallidiluteum]
MAPSLLLRTVLLVLALIAGGAARAEPRFEVPIACAVGSECFLQNYMDEDPGPGAQDYTCGPLSYEGHNGTDFRLRDLVAMARGMEVLAAAAGKVARVRDGMDDVNVRTIGIPALGGRDAGNAVVIDHGDGWETQYSHLRKGSVRVAPGDRVEAGQPLGLVGLSGRTEFPHVDFEVRKDGRHVDPFVGPGAPRACGGQRRPLWTEAAQAALAYQASGVLIAGFSAEPPEAERVRRGEQRLDVLSGDPAAIRFWVDAFGGRRGDTVAIGVTAPDGRTLTSAEAKLDRNLASMFLATETQRPAGGWRAGCYRGAVELRRDGRTVFKESRCLQRPD